MTGTVIVRLPVPPSANTMWRRVGNKTLLSKKYREWRGSGQLNILEQGFTELRIGGPLSVDITCKRPRKNCDIDNRIKPVLDLLQAAGVIEDDKHVMEVTARWGDVEGAEVRVERLLEGVKG